VTASRPIRILLVDDNPLSRAKLRSWLESPSNDMRIEESSSNQHALAVANRFLPDVILIGGHAASEQDAALLAQLARRGRVVVLSAESETQALIAATSNGATGFVLAEDIDAHQIRRAVQDVYRGRIHLSPTIAAALLRNLLASELARGTPQARQQYSLSTREVEVMAEIVRGYTNREIARRMVLSEKTVKNHVNRIFRKLGVTSRGSAIAQWIGTAGSPITDSTYNEC
jgi:DNA-binding NarL/FixJ family response regulator